MSFEIEQPFGKLDYAALSVGFQSSTQGNRPQHGVVVTSDHGSRTEMGSNARGVNISTSIGGQGGDTLRRSITWMVNQASNEPKPLLSWEIWVTLRHDGDALFIISSDVSCQLQGPNRIWALWPKSPIQPRTVQPQEDQGTELLRQLDFKFETGGIATNYCCPDSDALVSDWV
ncbi:uncharacterized protein N7483_000321 [Penicillium malachiteum]|uniref:uncharacterized protein n=1 Tax=Penicillium malachiteum TaxID=1324776 RepID=UPI002547FD07|nr:uncharacterized protein N7483_000321 [Penicillium malachiteum]KAJ5735196.1 hypothetical protein N7483_000321 [Penicillium malachiteum]